MNDQQNDDDEVIAYPVAKTPSIPCENGGYRRNRDSENRNLSIPELHEFIPFPSEALPGPLHEFVKQGAESHCCDESFFAMPLLAGLASAIGNSHSLLVKRGWSVPPIVWTVVLAESGSNKSAPFRAALRPVHQRQKALLQEFDREWTEYQKQFEVYQRDLAAFRKSKADGSDPPEEPEKPICLRVVVKDTTIEALGKQLAVNPRGVLSAADELSGWFAGFNRYKSGRGSDESQWLEFFNAQTSIIDRASSPKPLVIDKASVCVTGTIQPEILRKHLTADHKASGLAARLLFAMPPRAKKRWTEDEIDEAIEDQVHDIFKRLFNLEMSVDENGSLSSNLVRLDSGAKQLFISYFNRHNREQEQLDGDLLAAYSKLEEYAARFALIIHCVRHAMGKVSKLNTLDADSMTSGIMLCEWFKAEAKRVYSILSESVVVTENRQLLNWCSVQKEPVTPYQAYRHQRSLGNSEAAECLLQEFVDSGLGEWVQLSPSDDGGRPTRGFRPTSYGDNPLNSRETVRLSPSTGENPAVLREWLP